MTPGFGLLANHQWDGVNLGVIPFLVPYCRLGNHLDVFLLGVVCFISIFY